MYIVFDDNTEKVVKGFEDLEEAEKFFNEYQRGDGDTYLDVYDDIDYQEWKDKGSEYLEYAPDTSLENS